jgi:hypothetical protein
VIVLQWTDFGNGEGLAVGGFFLEGLIPIADLLPRQHRTEFPPVGFVKMMNGCPNGPPPGILPDVVMASA